MEPDEHFNKAAHVLIGNLAEQLKLLPETQQTKAINSELYRNFLYGGLMLLDYMAIVIKRKNVEAEREELHPQMFHAYANSLLQQASWTYGKPRVDFNRSLFLENNSYFTWFKDKTIIPVLLGKPVLLAVTPASVTPLKPTKPKPKFDVITGGKDDQPTNE